MWGMPMAMRTDPDSEWMDLYSHPMDKGSIDHKRSRATGRAMRTLVMLFLGTRSGVRPVGTQGLMVHTKRALTWGECLKVARKHVDMFEYLDNLPLRVHVKPEYHRLTYEAIPENYTYQQRDAELHPALQDLGYQILWDAHEACEAFNNPDIYYPGVEQDIEPVHDDHIRLVIWGMQRELNRETRLLPGMPYSSKGRRPAAPLAELPWRIQRALVERRRLRYMQWGIGQEEFEKNRWSFWNVPEEPGYRPAWIE